MRGVVMHAPGDVRVEDLPEPTILKPTDAIIRLAAACVCGSDLWPYRGADEVSEPKPMGHEYVGIVEQVGDQVSTIKPGHFVVGSFFASDNTCEICRAGYQTNCAHRRARPRGRRRRSGCGCRWPTAPWSPPPRPPGRGPGAEPAGRLRRARHRLVRRRGGRGRPGQDRRRGR